MAEYAAVADEHAGWADAEITSARALNDADRAELEAQVAKLAGGRVRATYREDAALLGGAWCRSVRRSMTESFAAQLQQLKQRLVNA